MRIICLLIMSLIISLNVCADGVTDAIDGYFERDNKVIYKDIDDARWAEEPIYYLAEYGVVKNDDGMLYPNDFIERKDFVELVIGAFGMYNTGAESNFSDVGKTSYYYLYVSSAYELGIINGVTKTRFGMNEKLTRQDMATIIYRLLIMDGVQFDNKYPLTFADSLSIDDYAFDAVYSLKNAGLISGNGDNRFLPHKYTTKAEAYKLVYNVLKNM